MRAANNRTWREGKKKRINKNEWKKYKIASNRFSNLLIERCVLIKWHFGSSIRSGNSNKRLREREREWEKSTKTASIFILITWFIWFRVFLYVIRSFPFSNVDYGRTNKNHLYFFFFSFFFFFWEIFTIPANRTKSSNGYPRMHENIKKRNQSTAFVCRYYFFSFYPFRIKRINALFMDGTSFYCAFVTCINRYYPNE